MCFVLVEAILPSFFLPDDFPLYGLFFCLAWLWILGISGDDIVLLMAEVYYNLL